MENLLKNSNSSTSVSHTPQRCDNRAFSKPPRPSGTPPFQRRGIFSSFLLSPFSFLLFFLLLAPCTAKAQTTTPRGDWAWRGTIEFNNSTTITDNIIFDDYLINNKDIIVIINNNATVILTGKVSQESDFTHRLIKKGNGKLILANPNNSFTCNTEIHGGSIQIGDGTTNGSIKSSNIYLVYDHVHLQYKTVPNTTVTFENNIYGSGHIWKWNTGGEVVINSYCNIKGVVTAQGGKITFKKNDFFNNATRYEVDAGATLRFETTVSSGLYTKIVGGGNVEFHIPADKNTTIAVANEYTGKTTISGGGNLRLSGEGWIWGNIVINDMSWLHFIHAGNRIYSGNISGNGGLSKGQYSIYANILTLTGKNTYTGKTFVTSGILQVGTGSETTYLSDMASDIDVATGATLRFMPNGSCSSTATGFSKNITGNGTLEAASTCVVLSGNDISVKKIKVLPSVELIFRGTSEITITSDIEVNGEVSFERTSTYGYAGQITGSSTATVYKKNTGTLAFTNDSPFSGKIALVEGTLQMGNGGANGMVAGNIGMENGNIIELSFNHGFNDKTYPGNIISGGNGSIIKRGTGKLILTGNHATCLGDIIVEDGTLQIGNGSTGSLPLASVELLNESSVLRFEPGSDMVFNRVISGAGSVQFKGDHTSMFLRLTKDNTYNGTTTVELGSMFIGNNTSTGSVAGNIVLGTGGYINFDRSNDYTYSGSISGSGHVSKGYLGGNSKLTLTGVCTYSGTTNVYKGVLQVGNGASGSIESTSGVALSAGTTLRFEPGSATILSCAITGDGKLEYSGTDAKVLILTGNNTYNGTTTIEAGRLEIGTGGTTGAIKGNIINNGNLVFGHTNNYTYNGIISGNGNVHRYGDGGSTTFTGKHTYTGATINSGGTFVLGASGEIKSSGGFAFNTSPGAKLDISAGNQTIRNLDGGANAEIMLGSKTLVIGLDGPNSGSGTYLGKFSGEGGSVFKDGFGTFTMGNSGNTATGMFTCFQGVVKFANENRWAGNVEKFSSSNLEIIGNLFIGGNLDLKGGTTVMNITTTPASKINVTGSVTATGTNTLNITSGPVNNHVLIQATSGITNPSAYTLYMPGLNGTLSVNSPTQLLLTANVFDVTAPTPGAGGVITGTTTSDKAQLSWTEADDDQTPQNMLRYYVYCSLSNNITSVANCESNGTLLNYGGTVNINTLEATQLEPNTNYYFNVVVMDMIGHKAAYLPKMLTTGKATLDGYINISTTYPTFGTTLKATCYFWYWLNDVGTVSYQWKRDGVNIGTNSDTYQVVEADITHRIYVVVTTSNCLGEIISAPTDPVTKAPQNAPIPKLLSRTPTSITLVTEAGCKYRINGGVWQTSPVFTGLEPNTLYGFNTHREETATLRPATSFTAFFSTEKSPPQIVSVTISPKALMLAPNNKQQFEVEVVALGDADESVSWSVSGNLSEQTKISSSGLLTIGSDETDNIITVKVTSVLDPKIYDEAIIFITKLGIEPITKEELQITVYPNPTTGQLRIESNKGINPLVSVEIFDVMGKKISSHHLITTSSHHLIDISHFTSGIYFLKITTETGAVTKKIIKQ